MGLTAVCTGCDKKYQLPHRNREWRCKVCNALLAWVEPQSTEDVLPVEDPGERRAAAEEMRRAMLVVRRLRAFLGVSLFFAVICLLGSGLLLLGDQAGSSSVFIALVWSGGTACCLLAAFYWLERRPAPVTVGLALSQTVCLAMFALNYRVEQDRNLRGLFVVWFLFFWAVAGAGVKLARLAKKYPDLYLSRKMAGEQRRPKGHDTGVVGVRSKRVAEEARLRKRRRFFLAGAAILVWLGVGVTRGIESALNAPPSPDDAVYAFLQAWNQVDLDELASLAGEGEQAKRKRQLEKVMRAYEWGERLPGIQGSTEVESLQDWVRVAYSTEGGSCG